MFRGKRKPRIDPETGELIDVGESNDGAQPKRKSKPTTLIKDVVRDAIVRRTSTKANGRG